MDDTRPRLYTVAEIAAQTGYQPGSISRIVRDRKYVERGLAFNPGGGKYMITEQGRLILTGQVKDDYGRAQSKTDGQAAEPPPPPDGYTTDLDTLPDDGE